MRAPLIFGLLLAASLQSPLAYVPSAQAQEADGQAQGEGMSKMPAVPAAAPKKTAAAKSGKTASATDYVVLRVNGDEIRRSEVLDLWGSLFEGREVPDFDTQDASIKKNVLTGLVSEKLALQEAEKAGIDSDPAMQKKLDMLRRQVLIQEWMGRETKSKVSEEAVRKFYEQKIAKEGAQEEVHARHILVKTPEEAKAAYDRLKKGEDFAIVAKAASIEKGSSLNGGDIGWVSKSTVVPEFAEVALKLKDKEFSKPVKTAFGWHIIQVLEHRTRQPAAFAEVKEQASQQALGQATRDVVQDLLKKADIQYLSPTGKELPFDRSLPGDISPKP